MKPRYELIALLGLIAVLIVVAAVQFLRPRTRRIRMPDGSGAAEAQEVWVLPSREEMAELVEWLAPDDDAETASTPGRSVLGIEGALASAERPPEPATSAVVPSATPFVEPPRLEGVLWRGNTRMALIEGETYRPGQRIRNTGFRVADIGRSWVTLRTDGGREIRLDLTQ